MAVVVPLRIETLLQQTGLVVFVFHGQPHVPARISLAAHPLRQFLHKVRVFDGVHRVQAQAVEAVFQQPHQRVVDKEVPHLAAPEVDGRAPRVCLSSRKKPLA